MTEAISNEPRATGSFHLTTAEKALPIPSLTWALMSVLLTFIHVMLWVPLRGPIGMHSLPVALLAAALAWYAFVRREQFDGRGWRALVRKAGSRLAVGAAVVISSVFLFRAAAGAIVVGW